MTDTTTTQPDEPTAEAAAEAAEATKSGIHQLYLAVLGFPFALADDLGNVFKEAVKRGEAIEPQSAEAFRKLRTRAGKAIEAPVRRTRTAVKDLGGRMRAGTGKGGRSLEQRLAARLEKMGVPTREQIQQLSDRVEALAAQVAELKDRRED